MRSWIFGGITLACATLVGSAGACPVGGEGVRPTRPVVQNASLQASEMIERAGRLDAMAGSREQQARMLDQEATTLANRARILRNESTFVTVSDRESILGVADELATRAMNDRARAAEERAQASSLRMEAQNLRQRAALLVRGWRGKSTTSPADRGITL